MFRQGRVPGNADAAFFWWHLDDRSQKVKEHEELSERLRKSESKYTLLPTAATTVYNGVAVPQPAYPIL